MIRAMSISYGTPFALFQLLDAAATLLCVAAVLLQRHYPATIRRWEVYKRLSRICAIYVRIFH
jgi:hypothetical protein